MRLWGENVSFEFDLIDYIHRVDDERVKGCRPFS